MAVVQRLMPSLLTDQVYDMIHQAIMSGELRSGDRLRIRELAEQAGTSVMPVREAIRKLEEAGLAERAPHKGAVVKGFSFLELEHAYDVRLLLEVEAARLGVLAMTPSDLSQMQRAYDAMRAAIADGRVVDTLDHDEELLAVVYRLAGNPLLVSTIRGMWQHCRAYKLLGVRGTLDTGSGIEKLWTFQEQLLAAASSRDASYASAISRDSLLEAKQRIRVHLGRQKADLEQPR